MTANRRITLALSVLTFVTLGVAFAVISLVLDRYQERELEVALLLVARAEAADAPGNHFAFTARPGPAANNMGPLEKCGVIYGEGGRVLAATHPFDAGPPSLGELDPSLDLPFDLPFGVSRYRAVVVAIPGYPERRLLLAVSREDLDADSRFARKAMAIAFFVSMVWLMAAIGWLIRRTMREHERIAEILHRIASGDVQARISGGLADRELRRVGDDVDEIAHKLALLIGYQRQFIAHAAHELRSPLAALHGEIQYTLRKERAAEEYRRSYAFLLRASTRLKHLADQLLELARAEGESKPVEPISVRQALADVVESLEPLAREKDIIVRCDPTDCAVRASNGDVERVVRNLLDNAIRHSPTGGTVRVEITPGEVVWIRVRDEGDGVPEALRERVFEPFHRSPAARAGQRGAGLGLAIARQLARKNGGEVQVDREPNCFTVSLPGVSG